jgi:hypothetical protein
MDRVQKPSNSEYKYIYCHAYDELRRIGLDWIGLDVVILCIFYLFFRNLFTPVICILVLACRSFVSVHVYCS